MAVIVLTISIGIGAYFDYSHLYLKKKVTRDKKLGVKESFNYQATIYWTYKWKYKTNRDQKSNLLLLQQHDQSQKFWLKLVKNRQKTLQRD